MSSLPVRQRSQPQAGAEGWFHRLGAFCTLLLTALGAATLGLLTVHTLTHPAPTIDLAHLLLSSFAIAVPSVVLATPLALWGALFCAAYCPPGYRKLARDVMFVLSACPPLIWALAMMLVVLPWLDTLGLSLEDRARAILVLCAVIAPPLARGLVEALRALPSELSFAGRALGANTFAIYSKILLPAIVPRATRELASALVRGLGEGVALYLVLGATADDEALAAFLTHTLLDPHTHADLAGAALILMVTSLTVLALTNAATGAWRREEEPL